MTTIEVRIPAIGDFKDVGVIEVFVAPGDVVKVEQALVALESDKATMEVPSPAAGTVQEVKLKVGDRVSEGSVVLTLAAAAKAAPAGPGGLAADTRAPAPQSLGAPRIPGAPPVVSRLPEPGGAIAPPPPSRAPRSAMPAPPASVRSAAVPPPIAVEDEARAHKIVHASPAVRQLARELGVDLTRVVGKGPHGRILHEDVRRFVKEVMSGTAPVGAAVPSGAAVLDLMPWPRVDFRALRAGRGASARAHPQDLRGEPGAQLGDHPHVTQHDEADITELEAFRVAQNGELGKDGVKLTLLAFLVKACVAALKRYPEVNASLDGDSLVLKRYFHIGFAADTPNGLVVPVIRDADQKGTLALARELAELAGKAREGKLAPADMQGGTFSISSLGGIGGTAFTPIINAPEVAILGVSRAGLKPLWDGKQFEPRLVLPLSLSYDHRVIDGALAARFTTYLGTLLADVRRMLL